MKSVGLVQHRNDLVNLCEVIAEQENLKVTITESGKGAMCAGFGALVGGLMGGPVGLAIGGTLGSITAAMRSPKYKSVVTVIRELSPAQKAKLASAIQKVLNNINFQSYMPLITLALTTASVKEVIIKELAAFLLAELSYRLA